MKAESFFERMRDAELSTALFFVKITRL